MINLSSIGKKPDKAKTEYPAIQDAGATALCDTVLKLADEFDALKGSLDLHKAELVGIAKPEYFTRFNGHADVPSSMSARASDGREVLVSLTNRYKKPSDEDLIRALMGEHAGRLLQKSFTLELDSNKVPLDKQQQVVDELVAVLAKFGCASALTATAATGPSDDFHVARHLLFPASVNLVLDGLMPMVAAVKTKGRGK